MKGCVGVGVEGCVEGGWTLSLDFLRSPTDTPQESATLEEGGLDLGLFGKSNRPSRRRELDLGLSKRANAYARGGTKSDVRIRRSADSCGQCGTPAAALALRKLQVINTHTIIHVTSQLRATCRRGRSHK